MPDSSGRSRGFAFLVYPDSCKDDWMGYLYDTHIPIFISPLHQPEESDTDDSRHKPHYHVQLMFDGKHTLKQIKDISDHCSGVQPISLFSIRGYARYLIHRDDPKKIQYKPEDVIEYAGADYFRICTQEEDCLQLVYQIMDFADKYHIYNYAMILNHARLEYHGWMRILAANTGYARTVQMYLKGKAEHEYNLKEKMEKESKNRTNN